MTDPLFTINAVLHINLVKKTYLPIFIILKELFCGLHWCLIWHLPINIISQILFKLAADLKCHPIFVIDYVNRYMIQLLLYSHALGFLIFNWAHCHTLNLDIRFGFGLVRHSCQILDIQDHALNILTDIQLDIGYPNSSCMLNIQILTRYWISKFQSYVYQLSTCILDIQITARCPAGYPLLFNVGNCLWFYLKTM